MKKIFGLFVAMLTVGVGMTDGFAATTKRQSAINMGTKVRGRVEAAGVYDEACYEAYYGCMDQFCIVDNEIGGSCNCSDEVKKYESALDEIRNALSEAERIRTEEVEKVQAGANADIIFQGTRQYDDKGNVISVKATKDKNEIKKSMWSTSSLYDTDEEYEDEDDSIYNKTGNELYSAAHDLCKKQIDSSCDKDMSILTQMYARQIVSDCKGLANSVDQKKTEAKTALNEANKAVRDALRASLEESNKYDRGTCMVEYRNCMRGQDACGADWSNCVFTIASENMQNNKAKSVKNTKVKTTVKYSITPSTMEILESKRFICEKVLDSCVAVRDLVWDDFLRDAAPTIRLAELNIESQKRQSCLGDIAACIQKACKDDIAGKGTDTMDACLARPDMARSFCKIQIEPCERMEPQIWDYVKSKLAAMRVDACTNEVKDCFTDETRCGKDFSNCIGMDYDYIHEMCPIDKLVVCKQNKSDFSMADLDSMLMGLYLNIDNKALENCQNLVESKMLEICGSTTDCNQLATNETIGTGSLRSQKDKNIYRITGMISFGSLKVGMQDKNAGLVDIEDYMTNARQVATEYNVPNADGILDAIQHELEDVQGTISQVVNMIGSDPQIKFCVEGRNLEQITGKKESTTARFPNLLNQVKQQIAIAALRQAQSNYQTKYNELLTKATKDASTDVAQYMCQMLPVTGGAPIGGTLDEEISLAPPYAISYEVGAGLNNRLLSQGGRGSAATTEAVHVDSEFRTNQASKTYDGKRRWSPTSIVSAAGDTINQGISVIASMGDGKMSYDIPGGTRESWALFNRETRNCHFCTSTVTKNCSSEYKKGFLGIGAKQAVNCTEGTPVEKCEDIAM